MYRVVCKLFVLSITTVAYLAPVLHRFDFCLFLFLLAFVHVCYCFLFAATNWPYRLIVILLLLFVSPLSACFFPRMDGECHHCCSTRSTRRCCQDTRRHHQALGGIVSGGRTWTPDGSQDTGAQADYCFSLCLTFLLHFFFFFCTGGITTTGGVVVRTTGPRHLKEPQDKVLF